MLSSNVRSPVRVVIQVGAALLALAVTSGVASAQRSKGVCKEDRLKLCPDVSSKDVVACLDQHNAELSEECRQLVKRRMSQRSLMSECQDEIMNLCSEYASQSQAGYVKRCLMEHKDQLSPSCANILPKSRRVAGPGGGKEGRRRKASPEAGGGAAGARAVAGAEADAGSADAAGAGPTATDSEGEAASETDAMETGAAESEESEAPESEGSTDAGR